MKGTSRSHTWAMTLTPPKMTSDTSTTMAKPHGPRRSAGDVGGEHLGHSGRLHRRPNAEGGDGGKGCKQDGSHTWPKPAPSRPCARSRVPKRTWLRPACCRLWSFTRYFTAAKVSAYLVAMPNTPVSHIQSTAPGPPAKMAVPTPTMLPVPMVAESAVHKRSELGNIARGIRVFGNGELDGCGQLALDEASAYGKERCAPPRGAPAWERPIPMSRLG